MVNHTRVRATRAWRARGTLGACWTLRTRISRITFITLGALEALWAFGTLRTRFSRITFITFFTLGGLADLPYRRHP